MPAWEQKILSITSMGSLWPQLFLANSFHIMDFPHSMGTPLWDIPFGIPFLNQHIKNQLNHQKRLDSSRR